MADSSQEKTEDATPKKLREARNKGQVAKSRDLTTVFVMVAVFFVFAISLKHMSFHLKQLMEEVFTAVGEGQIQEYRLWELSKLSLFALAQVLWPILLAGFLSAILIGMGQVGAIFTTEPLMPKFEKLNPIEGFKNMFKMVTFIELIKNIAKLSLVLYLAYSTVKVFTQEILLSSQITLAQSVALTGEMIYLFLIKVVVVFFVIALIDIYVQRWNYLKNLRMTKDEIKREYKQDEGDPQIKSERRRIHRDMVFGDVKNSVKKSNAVVSNPVHVAVAIRYSRDEMAAPEIMAKGQQNLAEMILQVAREENIPIVRNIPLAWSLLQIEEGEAIPEDLYEPVAEVLAMIYEMQHTQQQKPLQPVTPSNTVDPKDKPASFNPF